MELTITLTLDDMFGAIALVQALQAVSLDSTNTEHLQHLGVCLDGVPVLSVKAKY